MHLVLRAEHCTMEHIGRLLVWCFNKGAIAFTLRFNYAEPNNQYSVSEVEAQMAPSLVCHMPHYHFVDPEDTSEVPFYALQPDNIHYLATLLSEMILGWECTSPRPVEGFGLYRDRGPVLLGVIPDTGCYLLDVQPSEEQELLAEGIPVEQVEE